MRPACVARAQDWHRQDRGRVLAGVRSSCQREDHLSTTTFASGRRLRVGRASRCTGLQCCYSSPRSAEAIVVAGDCTWLSRPHIWILARRTRASDRWENAFAILARSVCTAAQSRSLDRFAGRRKSTCGDGLRCEKRQAARAEKFYSDLTTPGTLSRKAFSSPY